MHIGRPNKNAHTPEHHQRISQMNETIQSLLQPPAGSSSTLHQRSKSYWAQCGTATVAASTYYERQAQVLETEVLPGIGPVGHALDIGCADGRFTQILGRHARHVLGIDISAPLIASAQRAAAQLSHVRFQVQDAEAQLPAGPFDLISCMGVLSTLVDEGAFEGLLKDMAQRLPHQGWLISKDTVSTVEEQRRVESDHALVYRNWSHYQQVIQHAGFELTYRSDLAHWTPTQVNVLCVWRRKADSAALPPAPAQTTPVSEAIEGLQHQQAQQSELLLEMARMLQTLEQGVDKLSKAAQAEPRATPPQAPHRILRKGPANKVRCAFIIHHATAWAALRPVVDRMLAAQDFEVVLISSPHRFPLLKRMGGEADVHAMLQSQGYTGLRLMDEQADLAAQMMASIAPDVVFRQAPWDYALPQGFSTDALRSTRVCYVPYGYMTAKIEQFQFNQVFHRHCWRIFCPDDLHQQLFAQHNLVGDLNCRITGYPKFDDLLQHEGQRNAWPLPDQPGAYRLIWAPHFSHDVEWLRFGAFMQTAPALLQTMAADPTLQVVLRPHPAMLESMLHGPKDSPLAEFAAAWMQLPNTALSVAPEYGDLFGASDALLTDGLSFFSEYQLFDKPLVFFDRQDHVGFNAAGAQLLAGMYQVTDGAQMSARLQALRAGQEEPQVVAHRRQIAQALRPFPGEAADRIVQIIRSDLLTPQD